MYLTKYPQAVEKATLRCRRTEYVIVTRYPKLLSTRQKRGVAPKTNFLYPPSRNPQKPTKIQRAFASRHPVQQPYTGTEKAKRQIGKHLANGKQAQPRARVRVYT